MNSRSPTGTRGAADPDRDRIRILHVVQNLNYGGLERLISELCRSVDPGRFDMHVLALEYLGRFSKDIPAATGQHVADPLGRLSMLYPAGLARQMGQISPDIVHTHSGVWYKASLAAREARVPWLIHTEHGRPHPDRLYNRFIDGLAGRRTDVIVAVSEALSGELRDRLRIDPSRISIVPNGVDTSSFRPRRQERLPTWRWGIPEGVPVIGSVGRLEPVKAYDLMVRAFSRLRAQWEGPDRPHLVLVGDGTTRASLERLAHECGMEEAVHFLGWRDDIPEVLSAFSVFSLSSMSEGTSVSLLEAMAAGVCPVVTAVGGNPAVLGPKLRHRLVPPGDAAALAFAWRQAFDDPARRRCDGISARRRIRDEFSLRGMVSRYEQLYLSLGLRHRKDSMSSSVPRSSRPPSDTDSATSGRNTS